jgi:lysophospholipid acyltransferase (LPLAT)-like uncharacterized protein
LLPAFLYGRPDIAVLVSQHADGQLIAGVAEQLGFATVRGSTTRGASEAGRRLLRRDGHLAITPDGPRGPRRQVQTGVVYLAAKLGLPIVPFGVGYDQPWRAKSWDRFAIPRPGSRAVLVTDQAMFVPADADRTMLEEHRRRVEAALLRLTSLAESWAEQGIPSVAPGPSVPLRRSA